MSNPFSSDHLADIRDGARRMVQRTRAHADDLNTLVETAEGVARHATALTMALARPDASADELCRMCSDQERRSVENADATVRACVSAREQQVTAHRLNNIIDNGSADPHEMDASRTAAVLVVDDVEGVRDLIALVLRDATPETSPSRRRSSGGSSPSCQSHRRRTSSSRLFGMQ